jgi:peroxiredoxin/mono/diheme cytochrome c family protein
VRLFVVLLVSLSVCVAASQQSHAKEAARLEKIDLVDFRGRTWRLEEFKDDSLLVVAFLGTECPLAKLYSVRLQQIADDYGQRGVRVLAVMSNRQDSLEEIAAFATRQKLEFPILKDAGNRFADQMGAERTPEIFVYDAQRQLRYRGRVDDQYGIGYVREEPRRHDLKLALDELLSGREVALARTSAVGCIIGRSKDVDDKSEVTYGGEIAKILHDRCVECHRDGEIAPFSLTDYEEVAGWSDMIAEVVREGRMPPWHAKGDHAEFANDRTMTEQEKQALYDWAEAGAPAGDLSNLPEPPEKVAGWQLPREPDLVVPVSPTKFNVPATGAVRYQYFQFDPKFDKDMWIQAAELKPGNREVVHHILAFAAPKGERRGINGARGFLVGYVPGARLQIPPAGYAKKIPAGSELIFQVHYTPIGTPQTDQSELGFVFVDEAEVTHEIVTTSAVQPSLDIPPGDPDYQAFAPSPPFPADAELLSMSPHMHVRGKAFRYDLQSSEGKKETVLDIPEYDFNWQTTYILKEPLKMSAGSRFLCTATFDNSQANLNNPDPQATVRWGDQTWDEMMIGYYHYAVPIGKSANSKLSRREQAAALIRNAARVRIFDQLDTDNDGKLSRRDTPRKFLESFDQLDKDKDDVLTREEVSFAD